MGEKPRKKRSVVIDEAKDDDVSKAEAKTDQSGDGNSLNDDMNDQLNEFQTILNELNETKPLNMMEKYQIFVYIQMVLYVQEHNCPNVIQLFMFGILVVQRNQLLNQHMLIYQRNIVIKPLLKSLLQIVVNFHKLVIVYINNHLNV